VVAVLVAGGVSPGLARRVWSELWLHAACDLGVFLQSDRAILVHVEAFKGLRVWQLLRGYFAIDVLVELLEYAATGRLSGSDG
jgi:hypothetical protein